MISGTACIRVCFLLRKFVYPCMCNLDCQTLVGRCPKSEMQNLLRVGIVQVDERLVSLSCLRRNAYWQLFGLEMPVPFTVDEKVRVQFGEQRGGYLLTDCAVPVAEEA